MTVLLGFENKRISTFTNSSRNLILFLNNVILLSFIIYTIRQTLVISILLTVILPCSSSKLSSFTVILKEKYYIIKIFKFLYTLQCIPIPS